MIYLPLTIFHNCCLSGPYLGKYKRDWNKTWFIVRWQWAEGQCIWTTIIPCIFTELYPLKHLFVHNGWLSEPNLGKYTRYWNKTFYINRCKWKELHKTQTITLCCILLSYLPLTIFVHVFVYKWCWMASFAFYRQ